MEGRLSYYCFSKQLPRWCFSWICSSRPQGLLGFQHEPPCCKPRRRWERGCSADILFDSILQQDFKLKLSCHSCLPMQPKNTVISMALRLSNVQRLRTRTTNTAHRTLTHAWGKRFHWKQSVNREWYVSLSRLPCRRPRQTAQQLQLCAPDTSWNPRACRLV